MSICAWGANSHGQLGLGYESELCMAPQLLTRHSFNVAAVRAIRGGGGHVMVLDSFGRIHTCGWNNRGQLGLDSEDELHNHFQCVPSIFFEDVPVESIACGWDTSGCITVTKQMYVWGSNSFQQLGVCQRGFTAVRRPLALKLPRGDLALRCSFGLRHIAVLTTDSKVYVFGRLRVNDLPSSEVTVTSITLNRATVIKITPNNGSCNQRFIALASGQNHVLIKVADDAGCRRTVALGDNKYGQSNAFQFDSDIRRIACGWTHNAALLKDQRIMMWGRNSYGQLGSGAAADFGATPVKLRLPDDVAPAHVQLGSEHGLVRSKEGAVYTWGWNEHGNCGNGSTENLYSPTLIDLPGYCRVAGAGAGFCFAVCDMDGE